MVYVIALLHVAVAGIIIANVWYLARQRRNEPAVWPSVTVLVPARNEETNLRRLLPSLFGQSYPAPVEVVVYNDGSTDGTGALLDRTEDPRLRVLHGEGPPPGWVGKVHALYQATREASGELYLFLDADAELRDSRSLRRLVASHHDLDEPAVLTGLTRLLGRGRLLVSLVPQALFAALPWPLVRRFRDPSLSALNGQCWMIGEELYHQHEPHEALPDRVLEDVEIGRYLKSRGVVTELVDATGEVNVFMYDSFGDAWRGFRKNAYLLMGGRPVPALVFGCLYALVWVAPPLVSPWFFASLYVLKAATDRLGRMPATITLFAPFSFVAGLFLQIDSTLTHWTGRATWKGRRV